MPLSNKLLATYLNHTVANLSCILIKVNPLFPSPVYYKFTIAKVSIFIICHFPSSLTDRRILIMISFLLWPIKIQEAI